MIEPHGGKLVNRLMAEEKKKEILDNLDNYFKLKIANRYVSDCEMIAIGGFSPLTGFMGKEEAESVIEKMELSNGLLWGIPIVLPVDEKTAAEFSEGDEIILLDQADRPIALMKVGEKFSLDKENYAQKVYKTTDVDHPGVKALMEAGDVFVGGDIELINRPVRENIDESYFQDPAQTRAEFEKRGWKTVVAFQTRNPIHRAHEYLIKTALESNDGILIHPLVGETKPDDIPADVRMRAYEVLLDNYFNKERVHLSVLPAAMHYAGPREAIHHMLMRKNYGCTHMIIGRDHAGVGDYYGTYEAQEMVDRFADKLGIQPIKFEHSFYCTRCENMATSKTCPHGSEDHVFLSGRQVRAMLREGKKPPKEFTRPEVAEVLMEWARGG